MYLDPVRGFCDTVEWSGEKVLTPEQGFCKERCRLRIYRMRLFEDVVGIHMVSTSLSKSLMRGDVSIGTVTAANYGSSITERSLTALRQHGSSSTLWAVMAVELEQEQEQQGGCVVLR